MLCGSHIKIWNLANHIKMLNLLVQNWKLRVWCCLFHFFHVICKISNMWTTKHLAQASCTELTLKIKMDRTEISSIIMLEIIKELFSKVIHCSIKYHFTPMYMLNRIRYLFESLLLQSPRNEIHLCAYKYIATCIVHWWPKYLNVCKVCYT